MTSMNTQSNCLADNKSVVYTTVFAVNPSGGNPCPIVPDADNLTTEDMLAQAKEFGCECLFLQTPDSPEHAKRFRYFTPGKELTSCGHATIAGIAYLISVDAELKKAGETDIETAAGLFHIHWSQDDEVFMEQFLPTYGPVVSDEVRTEIANALNIDKSDLGDMPIQSSSTSRPKLMVPIRTRKIMDNLNPDFPAVWKLCDKTETSGFYVCSFEGGEIYARQFPNNTGYNEDPATGIAASALGCYLANQIISPDDNTGFVFHIYQGQAMGRSSMIGTNIVVEEGKITKVELYGKALFLKEKPKNL